MDLQLFLTICTSCFLTGAVVLYFLSKAAMGAIEAKKRRQIVSHERRLKIRAIEIASNATSARVSVLENKVQGLTTAIFARSTSKSRKSQKTEAARR